MSAAERLSALQIAELLELPPPTPAQQRVIEAPLTPALVIAGAGSGKTETMAGRVVWLVANGLVRRDEILGLTFTRKAAGELAERIDRRLARIDRARPGAADPDDAAGLLRPRVSTYNSFADQIVREHAARIGRDADAAVLSPAASWLLARRVVLASRDGRLAERDDRFGTIVDAVQRLAAAALDHGADPAELARFGERVAAVIAPACNPQLANPSIIEDFHTAMSALPVLAGLVEEYAAGKAALGAVDFSDQVAGALTVVQRTPAVIAELRNQYRVVLLDEYQDTSVQQTHLLAAVFAEAAVMAVGDPHQSIYGWRGASADNLASFLPAFARTGSGQTYSLMTSWRNDQAILDAANALISGRDSGAVSVPPLEARPGAGVGEVSWRYETSLEDEAAAVADWFAERRNLHTGAEPHTGAILFRAKRHMTVFADALAARGIPHRILGLGGLLSAPEVVDVVAALRALSDPAQGSSLIRLLAGPRFAVGLSDLAALRDLARTLARRDESFAPLPPEILQRVRASVGPDEAVSLVDALDTLRTLRRESGLLRSFSPEGLARLREAAAVFHRLRQAASGPVPEVVRAIERELLLDVELAANEARGPARLAAAQLRSFLDEIEGFLAVDDRGTIASLLAWLDHAEGTDELMPRTEPPEPGVVQLLTIHGSKGLEWDSVAVVRMVASELPQQPRSTRGWISYGELPYPFRGDRDALRTLEWEPATGEEAERKALSASITAFTGAVRDQLDAEERRLAYVAVTRARRDLLLTGSWWAGQRDPRAPGSFLTEICDALGLGSIEQPEDAGDNPYAEDRGPAVRWPMDPLAARRGTVEAAAQRVREALAAASVAPDADIAALLLEREARGSRHTDTAPRRVAASRFKDLVAAGAGEEPDRPMPERPYRATMLGTRFHSWVEHRAARSGAAATFDEPLWDEGDEVSDREHDDELTLARLQAGFERSEWGQRAPLEVETEIDIRLVGAEGLAHVVCKLDAVYEREDRGGRIEIVDWKTGAPPRTAAERDERMLQLALYRLAYHKRTGVPLDQIDVALFYVADDLVIRQETVYSESELVHLWNAARAARVGSSSASSGESSLGSGDSDDALGVHASGR